MAFPREYIATTLEKWSPQMADNVLNNIPLLYFLQKKKHIEKEDGGRYLEEDLMYDENGSYKWYSGYEELDTSVNEVMTYAEFAWKQSATTVSFSGLESRINSGTKTQKHKLIKSRFEVAEKTMRNSVNTSLFSDGTGSNGKELGGLQLLVADDPTTGTVGGIDASTNTWWRNQLYDFSVAGIGSTPTGAQMKTAMNTMLLRTTRNADSPNLILAGEEYFTIYKDYVENTMKRIVGNEKGDGGFRSVDFCGIPVVYDPACDTNRMYFLNLDYLKFRVHRDAYFKLDRERLSTNQDASLFPMLFQGAFTVCNRSLQGVIIA